MLTFLSVALAAPVFYDEGIVLQPPADGPFAGGINAPTVDYLIRNREYSMYFESPSLTIPSGCQTFYSIGRATSPDGVTWTVDDAPVLEPDYANTGSNSACAVSQPAIVFDGETWHLFVSMGSNQTSSGGANVATGIGYATSTDGVTFTLQEDVLVPYEGVALGLASATILDGVIHLLYVEKPDLRLATYPVDGSAEWTFVEEPVLTSAEVGDWAGTWVFAPSFFCETDQDQDFSLLFGGDSTSGTRSLGFGTSADAEIWDWEGPLSGGDLPVSSLNHWDVLEALDDYVMWYSMTDPSTGLKAIGKAATSEDHVAGGSRMCPHPPPNPIERPKCTPRHQGPCR